MDSTPALSVVIVSFQVRELLDRCLASLPTGPGGLKPEVYVVDNASTDGTAAWVGEHFPHVRLIANTQNRGFAAANNQALRQARGRYLMLLNPDTLVPKASPNALETLVEFMDGHPRAGVCGPALRYPDGSFQQSAFALPSLAQIFFDLFPTNWRLTDSRLNGRYPRREYESGRPFKVGHPLGAALVARRQAAEQVGWLDEGFFIYAEEVDWCLRFHRKGWDVWCVPQAVIVHYEAQSTRQFREGMFVELWRARRRFFLKHHSRLVNLLAGEIVQLGMRRAVETARNELKRGAITQQEWQSRQAAYEAAARIWKSGGTGQR